MKMAPLENSPHCHNDKTKVTPFPDENCKKIEIFFIFDNENRQMLRCLTGKRFMWNPNEQETHINWNPDEKVTHKNSKDTYG